MSMPVHPGKYQIERYSADHLRTRLHDLQVFYGATPDPDGPPDDEDFLYLEYVPEFNLVYCLTRYVSTLGDSRYLGTPPNLPKWLLWEDAEDKIGLTGRQRDWGETAVKNLLFFMGESHTRLMDNQQAYILSSCTPQEKDKRLILLAGWRPHLTIAGFTVWTDGLLELQSVLQELKRHKKTVVRRRGLIAAFNWESIKKSSPATINRRIYALMDRTDRTRRYYGTGDSPNEKDVLYLGKNMRDSFDGLSDKADGSTEHDDLGEVGAARKKLTRAREALGDDVTLIDNKDRRDEESKLKERRRTWRNPKTGESEVVLIPANLAGESNKAKVPPPGNCFLCGFPTSSWICRQCRMEEDRWNTPPDDTNKIPNIDALPNYAWQKYIPHPRVRRTKGTPPIIKSIRSSESFWQRPVVLKGKRPPLDPDRRIGDVVLGSCWSRRIPAKGFQPIAPLLFSENHFVRTRPADEIVLAKPEYLLSSVKTALFAARIDNRDRPFRIATEIANMHGGPKNGHLEATCGFFSPWDHLFLFPYGPKYLALKIGIIDGVVVGDEESRRKALAKIERSVFRSQATLKEVLRDYFLSENCLRLGEGETWNCNG